MEIKKGYTVMFNTISDTIEELEKIIFKANNCLELLKRAQVEAEEIFISESEKKNGESTNIT